MTDTYCTCSALALDNSVQNKLCPNIKGSAGMTRVCVKPYISLYLFIHVIRMKMGDKILQKSCSVLKYLRMKLCNTLIAGSYLCLFDLDFFNNCLPICFGIFQM